LFAALLTNFTIAADTESSTTQKQWLAGDHHVHSQYSVGWDLTKTPPAPVFGGDAIYPTLLNAERARQFGLSWMVTTDHGGPNHSKITAELAYPDLVQSRKAVKEVIQFYGMELNTPAGEHSSMIIPHTHDEVDVLRHLESSFDRFEVFPTDPTRNTEDKMIEALVTMRNLKNPPIVIVNHPSRTAKAYGEYGLFHPAELRRWHDTAPDVAIGMTGAPGHQAFALSNTKELILMRPRGGYVGFPTMGGFDQMTAKVGGFWDSMLGEGRHWWITANSDSHRHHTEGGFDFWPGEYSKTYVFTEKNHDSILQDLRAGHVFVTTGDLIDALYVEVSVGNQSKAGLEGQTEQHAAMGDELNAGSADSIVVTIRFRDPDTKNANGDNPRVKRVDLIMGQVTGPLSDYSVNSNATARVIQRFNRPDWQVDGDLSSMTYVVSVEADNKPGFYFRVRGTNTHELEPALDRDGENPWRDLWFYSNPVFVKLE
jgi:hypothetical protein